MVFPVIPAVVWYTIAFGAGIGGYIYDKAKQALTIAFAIFGMSGTGKSTFHYSIEHDLLPVLTLPRQATTEPGQKYRKQINFRGMEKSPYWLGRDYQHNAEAVPDQIDDLLPGVIFCLIDVDNWDKLYNWEVLKQLAKKLASSRYRGKTKGKVPIPVLTRKGWVIKHMIRDKRCQIFVLMLNKIDKLRHYAPEQRAEFCERVVKHYTDTRKDSPMNLIREEYNLQFCAVSVQHGYYYSYDDLSGSPHRLKDYMHDIAEMMKQ